jgi:hypothetical protein
MDQRAIDGLRAQIDELRKRAAWYEELRQATDGGSESMTHEDAVEHVKALAAENKVLREAAQQLLLWENTPGTFVEGPAVLRDVEALRAALTKEATNG